MSDGARSAVVEVAECVAWAEAYDGPLFHALLCDPPYELGFMGRDWDRSGVAFNPDTWRALARVLRPGAFGMAFASSRGWHRLAVAIEDAGLVIHPSIFGWAFGSGFPKATRVADAPDFAGHRYGLQALKPALEPIIVFQKPYAGRPVDSITATGAGALNVDGGRVPTGARPVMVRTVTVVAANAMSGRSTGATSSGEITNAGRWPANLVVCHTPSCNGTCAPGCPVAALGAQSGESGPSYRPGNRTPRDVPNHIYGKQLSRAEGADQSERGLTDTGTAARFYHNPDFSLDIAERLAAAEPVRYVAKASRSERSQGLPDGERSHHPTVKPLALAQHLATLLLPPDAYAPRRLFVPFAGSGSECIGAMLAGWDEVVGVELSDEYADIARARLAWWDANRDKAPVPGPMRGEDWPAVLGEAGGRKSPSTVYGEWVSDRDREAARTAPPAATQPTLPIGDDDTPDPGE